MGEQLNSRLNSLSKNKLEEIENSLKRKNLNMVSVRLLPFQN